jgi:hypothetical protein
LKTRSSSYSGLDTFIQAKKRPKNLIGQSLLRDWAMIFLKGEVLFITYYSVNIAKYIIRSLW